MNEKAKHKPFSAKDWLSIILIVISILIIAIPMVACLSMSIVLGQLEFN